jgi:hypothetical protein
MEPLEGCEAVAEVFSGVMARRKRGANNHMKNAMV